MSMAGHCVLDGSLRILRTTLTNMQVGQTTWKRPAGRYRDPNRVAGYALRCGRILAGDRPVRKCSGERNRPGVCTLCTWNCFVIQGLLAV